MSATLSAPTRPEILRLAAILSFLQIIGWGSTFNAPAVIWRAVSEDLGFSKEWVFAGTAVMLIVSALFSPAVGRMFDRRGPREAMAVGFVLVGLGLFAIGVSVERWSYLFGWAIMGLGAPLALMQASVTVMAQQGGQHARFGMAMVTIFTAMSPAIFWPLTTMAEAAFGWRGTFYCFAALNALVCAPLALVLVPAGGPRVGDIPADQPGIINRLVPPESRERAIRLFAIATSLQGFASWGLFLHMIGLMEALGHAPLTALALASLLGPASVFARATDLVLSRWLSAIDSALIAVSLMVATLLLLGPFGQDAFVAGVLLSIYSLGAGAMALGRSTIPLELFGREGYATVMGRIGLPQHLAYAVAPTFFAATLSAGGAVLTLSVGALLSFAALVLLLRLRRLSGTSQTPQKAA
jgi:predicted MFS family arabinose efflux permease